MKLSIDGLTLGCIASLESKGYDVVIDGDTGYADVTAKASGSSSVRLGGNEGWGSLGEYME